MQIVNTGNIYKVYDNSLQTYNQLPARAYQVNFDKMSGFYLSGYDDIVISEKIYGVHQKKVDKVMKSFKIFERNLGVILSGAKGIGKSLFAKLLSITAVEEGYPLVIVNQYIPGIADYINSIQQEVVVLFDEFDKTFNSKMEHGDPQAEMLTLFDGLSIGKKLFVVTCNEIRQLNEFLINRPGRFHYHFRFEYPTDNEVREYLADKVPVEYHEQIEKVVSFSHKVDLNYDCLRAIAFELSLGISFEEAIKDLNIIKVDREDRYTLILTFKDGGKCTREWSLDMFGDEDQNPEFRDERGYDFYVRFNPVDALYIYERGGNIISPENITIDWEDHYYDDEKDEWLQQRKSREVEQLLIRRKPTKSLHYAV